jgi:hypothetical protein
LYQNIQSRIGNTIFEIKSHWTWDRKGNSIELKIRNEAKLNEVKSKGYKVILVLEGQEIDW